MRLLVLFMSVVAFADEPLDEASLFAVITHKGGIAKGLAHNHFIHATSWEAELEGDNPAALKCVLRFPVAKLEVDPYALATKWYPTLQEAAILDEAFGEVSTKDRGKIAEAMLGKKQLNVDKYPTIEARLIKVVEKPKKMGEKDWPHTLTVAVTIHDKEVTTEFAGEVRFENGITTLDALGELKFSDFGIKPYSAMFGAVANKDPFHILVHLVSKAPEGE